MATLEELQRQANRILGAEPGDEGARVLTVTRAERPAFSPFSPAQLEQAVQVSEQLMALADETGGEKGLAAALAEAERLREVEAPGLVEHALQLFIVHHAEGSRLSIPPVEPLADEERRPDAVLAGAEEEGELQLDYLREDLLANDHHRHWHLVYPTAGVPRPDGRRALQDRQGELFFYMHQQMLARYDAERLALGLDPVRRYDDYREPIAESYGDRPAGTRLVDVDRVDDGFQTQISVADLERQRDTVFAAVTRGDFTRDDLKRSLTALGAAEEPERGGELGIWHHGAGHMIAAWVMHPNGGGPMGLIGDTATAIRDPFFWRWHRHIDELGFQLQEQYEGHDFADAPPITLRGSGDAGGPDLILCLEEQLPAGSVDDLEAGRRFGEETFGGERFDDPPDPAHSTDELTTFMTDSPFDPHDPQTVLVHHLDHEPFVLFARLRNEEDARRRVTVRLFIAPAAGAEDRRAWIELDKFDVWLDANERAVVYRPMRLASVVRKPVTRPPTFVQPPARSRREQYCRCGWPYHLLLPRGTDEGMPFQLAAVVTDFSLDHISGDPNCGSLSFCGSLDKEFPDRREMGYPFNRPFRDRSITETLSAVGVTREVAIRHLDEP